MYVQRSLFRTICVSHGIFALQKPEAYAVENTIEDPLHPPGYHFGPCPTGPEHNTDDTANTLRLPQRSGRVQLSKADTISVTSSKSTPSRFATPQRGGAKKPAVATVVDIEDEDDGDGDGDGDSELLRPFGDFSFQEWQGTSQARDRGIPEGAIPGYMVFVPSHPADPHTMQSSQTRGAGGSTPRRQASGRGSAPKAKEGYY